MKNILLHILLLQIINISFQVVPLWNFESSTFNLFAKKENHTYNKVERELHGLTLRLEREILKENENIIVRNTLYLNNENFGITEYDDVESFYDNGKNYLICPKGKFHMYIYNKYTKESRIVKPNNFQVYGDWNLMCYLQYRYHTMFVAYLGDLYNFYEFNYYDEIFITNKTINHGLHAFKWKTEGYDYSWDSNVQMFAITQKDGYYFINNFIFNVNNGANLDFKEYNWTLLTQLKSKYIASFQKDTFNFYWMSYNNVSDLESGGHSNNEQITTANFKKIKLDRFTNSPLVFFEKMTIVELKFIFEMYFAYYTLKDDKGKFYYGIIDASRNRVIFHTDEEILKYIPYSDYAMLAITTKSAYKICVSRNENDC